MQNRCQTQTDSTLCENSKKSSPRLATISKSYRTMKLHSLQEKSANSAVNTEPGISEQDRFILLRTERPNASYKSSNVIFGRIYIKPHTVQFKPQQANSIQNAKCSVSFNVIVQYPTLRPEAHLHNSSSVVQYDQHWILFTLRVRSQS